MKWFRERSKNWPSMGILFNKLLHGTVHPFELFKVGVMFFFSGRRDISPCSCCNCATTAPNHSKSSLLGFLGLYKCTVMGICPWASYQIRKIAVCACPGSAGNIFPPPVSDPNMHHGTCVTHVPWCMPGSLTIGFLWSRWQEKRFWHPRRMHNTQFSVSGKRPIGAIGDPRTKIHGLSIWGCCNPALPTHKPTHTPAVLTTHGHSHTSRTHHTWPFTHQLYPHMAIHTPAVLTTHDH